MIDDRAGGALPSPKAEKKVVSLPKSFDVTKLIPRGTIRGKTHNLPQKGPFLFLMFFPAVV